MRYFQGRIDRSDYIKGTLILVALFLVALGFVVFNSLSSAISPATGSYGALNTIGTIFPLLTLAIMFFGVSLGIRRLHDINLSGWYYLLYFVPMIGVLFFLFIIFWHSNDEENKFAAHPQKGNIFELVFYPPNG